MPFPDPLLDTTLTRRTLTLATVALLVSACGGGEGDDGPAAAPPKIASQPAHVTVNAGASAEFRVEVQSSTAVSYQWLRNGSPISGATDSKLSIFSVTTADAGSSFSVQVSNTAGSVQSESAKLFVETPGWVEGIAAASSGALATLDLDRTALGFSASGDLFVWDRTKQQLTRLTAQGMPTPLLGSMQTLAVGDAWRISVLEHSDGSLYVVETYLAHSGQINTEHGAGGKIHRIAVDGAHSVVYQSVIGFGESPAGKVTPTGVAQDLQGNIYTLHFNSPTLYKISATGTPNSPVKFADLIPQPFDQLAIVFRYSVYLSLASTSSGEIFASSSSGRTAFTAASYAAFDYQVSTDGARTPIKWGATHAYDLVTHGKHVYALVKNEQDHMCLVRRNPDGTIQLIAGGSASTTQIGPLSGGIRSWIKLVGVTPEGRIVLGEPMAEEKARIAQYFVITPPTI